MSIPNSSGQQQHEQQNHDCSLCLNPPDEDMLTCVECQKIFHKNCADVVNDITFKCTLCSSIRPTSPTQSNTSSRSNRSHLSQKLDLRLQRLEEERKLDQEYLNKKLEEERQLNRDYLSKKYQILEEAETLTDHASENSQEVHNWLASSHPDQEHNQQTVDKIVKNTITVQTNNISQNASNKTTLNDKKVTATGSGLTVAQNNVVPTTVTTAAINSSTMPAVLNCIADKSTFSGYQQRMQPQKPHFPTYPPGAVNTSFPSNNNTQSFLKSLPQDFNLPQPISSTSYIHPNAQINPPYPLHQFSQSHNLSQNNINSRQALPKDLPIFSGHPEEWPIFFSTYEWSTAACAFTNEENLIRLQKALKGEALLSVQHMLIHPSNVPDVMQVLHMLFGQPEKILNSIKNRIQLTPQVNENNLKTLTSLAINVHSLISTITASRLFDEINNSSLLFDLIKKLPSSYQMQWATQKLKLISQNKKPNLYEFDKWLFNIGITASSITIDYCTNKQNKERIKPNAPPTTRAFINSHNEYTCLVCNKRDCKKTIGNCSTYMALDRGERWNIVRKHKLCKFCLRKHSGECNKKKRCGEEGCEYFHHPSLHRYSELVKTPNEVTNDIKNKPTHIIKQEVFNNAHSAENNNTLFKIIPVKIFAKKKEIKTFAFIDEGSSISLIDEALANRLELKGEPSPLCLRWTGGMERNEQSSKKLKIKISGGNKRQMALDVSTVQSLNLPMQSLDYKTISKRYRHLRNIPIESYNDAVPQILIGLNHFKLGLSNKIREGAPHEPVAVCTKLGWFIYGVVADNKTASKNFNFHICSCNAGVDQLDQLVRNFYTIDSVGISTKNPLKSEDDERALELLNKFTIQKSSGHYEVPLLWKFDLIEMPPSYEMALKRLICLERKLKQDLELYNVFKQTISKYLLKGYIRKLSAHEIDRADKKIWYLPIFAVHNKNKPGKSRIVWDAAAKSNGMSLNSYLLKGPDYLASLPAILLKFRQKSVAICGDIEEMFHQIHIRPDDRDVQRFLWRDCQQDKSPDIYVMDVMIFGATCAPSISQYIKNFNASKFEDKFPMAAKAIKENHYVDDFLDSVDDSKEAAKLISDVSSIHRQAGFNIRNWISNDKEIVKSIRPTENIGEKCLNIKEEKQIEKVLGIFWEHQEDVITFKISEWLLESDIFDGRRPPTKREMLRLVMSIYDPLGLIGHIIMYVKVIMQEVWRSKIEWDEHIPHELFIKWSKWVSILPNVCQIKIPRCYLKNSKNYNNTEVQLHTFVDASKDGYAAVCYFRIKKYDNITCSIIGSKTRVAPIKITSIPRLELMAALIGARFAKYVVDNSSIKISKNIYWTDSKTVLSWINSDHRKYNQFVAFRITEILELSSINEWRWISSKQNVADDATKWSKTPIISNSSRWLQGPEFLMHPENKWPLINAELESTREECVQHFLHIKKSEIIFNAPRFSKWKRLVRTAAYVLRFINNCRTIYKETGELTQNELLKAEKVLFMQAQSEKYSHEISLIKANLAVPKSSDIYNKNPYLDDGILRVYGRLDNANISFEQKRPIILPRKNYITTLILLYYHERLHHINHETAVNELRQKYSISKLRTTFKSVIRQCQMCKLKKARPRNPQMAMLPSARVASNVAPFAYTGIDFFGPFLVTVNRHKEKRYGCLFTCLSIRAVHIEVAHSLTTTSCILAIRNFMARRGIPLEFYSDNGTNFVSAERQLREALADVDKDELVKTFTTTTTKWNFNPPASPHMGGAWERLIRSVKTILYKIMPSRSPTDDLLLSMLIEVENVINSRPLAYIPVDSELHEALTPNHFLVGSSSGLKPLTVCDDSGILLTKSWRISQQYANQFWKKWLTEYLPSLTLRPKWHDRCKPLSQGDLVIIVDPSSPRNIWLRGKVLETRLASDGQVRSAKVLTKSGVLERPATKLAILEVAPRIESGGEEISCHTVGGMLTPPTSTTRTQ